MKIYKVVEVLGAVNDTGKLACDMYELGKKHYYSKSHGQKIPISEMDFQYMVRAFVKQNDRESEDVEYWRNLYYECASTKGHYYTFSEVPQDEEGKEFVKNCRKYLNKESYKIRVKGQHLKKELYGQGKAYHGANMEDCSHLRVYIDKKRGDE